jgi:hypothetical protein
MNAVKRYSIWILSAQHCVSFFLYNVFHNNANRICTSITTNHVKQAAIGQQASDDYVTVRRPAVDKRGRTNF